MAVPTDPSFGAGFDAAGFRQAITSTMEMGLASGTDVATFYWNEEAEYSTGGSVPYDITDAPTRVVQAAKTLVVPVAVEFVSRTSAGTGGPMGGIDSPRVVLTLLDSDYEDVIGADGVEFSDAKYTIDYTAPVMGLFGVNVYQIYASALDESA